MQTDHHQLYIQSSHFLHRYEGFPKSVCTSINNVVCHGIPDENEILEEGDIINVDVSTILNGYYSDASRMFTIGELSPEAERIVRVTRECVELGLKEAKPWGHLGDIAHAINSHAKANGYSVVEEIGGHGIGLDFHEDPFVSYVTPKGSEVHTLLGNPSYPSGAGMPPCSFVKSYTSLSISAVLMPALMWAAT